MLSVRVFCNDEHHVGDRVLAVFDNRAGKWKQVGTVKGNGGYVVPDSVVQPLTSDALDRQTMGEVEQSGHRVPERHRLALRCCGADIPGRMENVEPIFDLLAAHRVSEISLQGLAARLAGK